MPGTIVVKPIQAKLEAKEGLVSLDPYCVAIVGDQSVSSQVCKKGGKTPSWEDTMTISAGNEPYCYLEVKDKSILKDKMLGVCAIDLDELTPERKHEKWYELYSNKKPVGEILVEIEKLDEGEGMRSSYDKLKNEPRRSGYEEEQTTRASYDVFRDETNVRNFSGENEKKSYDRFRNEPMPGQHTPGFTKEISELERMNQKIDQLLNQGRAWEGQERSSENVYQERQDWSQSQQRSTEGGMYSSGMKENVDPNRYQYERNLTPQWNQEHHKDNLREFKDKFTYGVEHTDEMPKRSSQNIESYGIDEDRLRERREDNLQENEMIQKMREVVEEAMEEALVEAMEEAVEEAMEQAVEEAIEEAVLEDTPYGLQVLKETLFGDLFETLEDLELREQILRDEIRQAELEAERDEEEDDDDLGRLNQQERELLRRYDYYDDERANEYFINLNDVFRNFEEEEEEIYNMLMNDVEQWTRARDEEELEKKRAQYQELRSEEEIANPETIYNMGKDEGLKIEVIDPLEQALLDNIYKAYDLMAREEELREEPIDILNLRTVVEPETLENFEKSENARNFDYGTRSGEEEGYHRVPNFDICQKPEIEITGKRIGTLREPEQEPIREITGMRIGTLREPEQEPIREITGMRMGTLREEPVREVTGKRIGTLREPEQEPIREITGMRIGTLREPEQEPIREITGMRMGTLRETPTKAMNVPEPAGLMVTSIPIVTDIHSPAGKTFEELKNTFIPAEISMASEAAIERVEHETGFMQENVRGSIGGGSFERPSMELPKRSRFSEAPLRSGLLEDDYEEEQPKKHRKKMSMFDMIYNDFMESARVQSSSSGIC